VFVYNFLILCTFSEWKLYKYDPRIIRFASETDNSLEKCVLSGINLPLFSSASVPKVL
jgi:general transcription factor 3C polypeptide 2